MSAESDGEAGNDDRGSGIAPIRTCVGCRKRRPQYELVRFVHGAEASIVEGRTLPGRGAWLCKNTLDECRQLAERRGAFARAFRLGDRSPGGR